MEPSSLNSPEDKDAGLVAMLRKHTAPIPDDGFSARVLSALPPTPRAASRSFQLRLPWVAYIGGGVAGAAVAVGRAGSWSDFISGIVEAMNALNAVSAALTEPWLGLALVVATFSVVIALLFTQPRRWLA